MGFVAVWLLWIWGVQGVPDNFIVVLSVERHLVLTQVNFGTECSPRNDKPWHLDGRYLRAVLRGGLQIALVKCFISREKLCCAVEGWLVGDGILVEESLRCVTAKVFPEVDQVWPPRHHCHLTFSQSDLNGCKGHFWPFKPVTDQCETRDKQQQCRVVLQILLLGLIKMKSKWRRYLKSSEVSCTFANNWYAIFMTSFESASPRNQPKYIGRICLNFWYSLTLFSRTSDETPCLFFLASILSK